MPATRQKKRQDKVGRNEEEGSPGQRKLAHAAREIRRFFETGDAVLDQNIVPFINQLAPDVNFTADEAEQTSPYSIDWVGNTKRFAKAVKSFRALAKKEKYDVPEDSGLNIKYFQKETSDEEEEEEPTSAEKQPKSIKKQRGKDKLLNPDSRGEDAEDSAPATMPKQINGENKPKVTEASDNNDGGERASHTPAKRQTKVNGKLPTPDVRDEDEKEPAPAKNLPKAIKKSDDVGISDSDDGEDEELASTKKQTKGKNKLPTPDSEDDGEEEEAAPAEKQPTRQKKAVSIEEDLDMRNAMNEEEDSSADDSSEEQDNIWPLLYQKVNPQSLTRPGWRALQQDCVLHGCDFADVKFRLEFLLTHENSEETPSELLHSARKWIGTCPQALEYLDNDFYGDREMSKRFSAYRSKHRRVARIVSSRSISADHEKLDRFRLTSADPEADRRELGFIDRTVPADGSDQITLGDDPDDPEADSVTGTIVMSVSHFLGVKLDSLNEEHPHAERHVLVKQSDCTSKRCPQSKITRASDKDSLKNLKRSDISVVNFVSAKDDNNDRWPRTYVVGYIKKKRDEGLRVWSRSIFRSKFGSGVDDEINAARRQCGQQEIRKR